MSVKEAIRSLAEAGALSPRDATARMAELARDGLVATRIASLVDGRTHQPRRNVPMARADWIQIFELESGEWHEYGSVSFDDDNQWLGIEVNRRDLAVYLDSRRASPTAWRSRFAARPAEVPKPMRKKPGPKPHPLWQPAVEHVTSQCIKAGYKKPLKRGDKAAIQGMLLSYITENGGPTFSEDAARMHSAKVIDQLPEK